jgi:hypothetical protein
MLGKLVNMPAWIVVDDRLQRLRRRLMQVSPE